MCSIAGGDCSLRLDREVEMSKRDLLAAVIAATAGLSTLSVHASSVTNTPILAAVDFGDLRR